MSILLSLFDAFWKQCKKGDDKTHARQTLPDGIKEENNLPYLDDGSHYHLLDAYYPENNNGNLPVIIDIHGGGWMYADKELNKIYCEYLASRGFIVFNLSYRLVPEVTTREQLQDVCAALKWINENLSRFPADRANIMLTGDSAGGQLCAYAAALAESERLRQHFGTVDPELKISCITLTSPMAFMNTRSLVGCYTRIMWGEKPVRVSVKPYLNLNEVIECVDKFPPVLCVTSSGDLARGQTIQAHELFLRRGIEARLLDFPKFEGKNLLHVFGVLEPDSPAGRIYLDRMCAFFREHFAAMCEKA